jgi:hypothetical protein
MMEEGGIFVLFGLLGSAVRCTITYIDDRTGRGTYGILWGVKLR